MPRPVLEVIATSVREATAAVRGGADRLEIVSDMDRGGLTPSPSSVDAIRESLPDVPLRIMLRNNGGFGVTPAELHQLTRRIRALREVGASAFVFGFVGPTGEIDTASTGALADAVAPSPWTFHHAFDLLQDPVAAWQVLTSMTGVDLVLTAGSTRGLSAGLPIVCSRGAWQRGRRPRFLAGGGLLQQHAAALRRAGITQFHVGRGARPDGTWRSPVDVAIVRRWRDVLDGRAHAGDPSGT